MQVHSEIEETIIRYLNNAASTKDLNSLTEWIENPANKELFKDYAKTHFTNNGINDPETSLAIQRFLSAVRKEKSLVHRIKTLPAYVHTIAASVILFLAFTVFTNRSSDTSEQFESQIITNTPITPGTDKATLTLANGDMIALEEGAVCNSQIAESNGKQIVYKDQKSNSNELSYNYLTIPRKGEYHLVLADGTQVWLNSETQIKYPVNFKNDGSPREVELVYGEAYFDVSPSHEHKGAPFKVSNYAQEIEVLGTEFNVNAYNTESSIYTTLVEGKVSINLGNKVKQILKPTEQSNLNLDTKEISVSQVNVKDVISWKNGLFSFRNKPLKNVMRVISRWYDVDVIFLNKELENITFKGVLGKDQNLDDILLNIKTLSIINNYKINGKTITLE